MRDLYDLDVPTDNPRWDQVNGKQMLSHCDCIQNAYVESPCAGAVEYRGPLTPLDRRWPHCEKHWAERVAAWGCASG